MTQILSREGKLQETVECSWQSVQKRSNIRSFLTANRVFWSCLLASVPLCRAFHGFVLCEVATGAILSEHFLSLDLNQKKDTFEVS